jgi:Transposase DDE domain
MIHMVDPRQNRLFDPFLGVIPAAGLKIIANGWQGVFRHALLETLPVSNLAENFSRTHGTPTKELYAMAGLVFLTDFFDWDVTEAVEAYIFRSDIQYALNLEPGAEISTRTVERYQKLFRDDELASLVFEGVTQRLVELLNLDVSRQRLDSTHVFSHMALFGRTKLMAVAIKRFLIQVKRHSSDSFRALPEEFRKRYEAGQSRLFANAKDAETRLRFRQQAAEDLLFVIEHFGDNTQLSNRASYKALVTIFHQQCEVRGQKVIVKSQVGGDCIQNPSDLNATFDGHKGPGYQVQLAETCGLENEVQLITTMLPQTACETDSAALEAMLDQLEESGRLPEEITADTAYVGDENVETAAARGVDLIGPVAGRTPENTSETLTLDDFALDERTNVINACPQGHTPLSSTHDKTTSTTRLEMPAEICASCLFRKQCPIEKTKTGRYVLEFTDKQRRLDARRVEENTEVFKERYRIRSGIESTNSGLKNRLGLGRLKVRGRGSVFRVIGHKTAGWNVLRAAAADRIRAWVTERMAASLAYRQA